MMMRLIILVACLLLVLKPKTSQSSPYQRAVECLTKNIYFEANNQSYAGQLAVALVVINRVRSNHFPDSVCDVIYQGPVYESWKPRKLLDIPEDERVYYPRRNRCQFSWYCDGFSDEHKHAEALTKAELAARQGLRGRVHDFTQNATHYHADYVNPKWAKTRTFIVQIGNHLFYK